MRPGRAARGALKDRQLTHFQLKARRAAPCTTWRCPLLRQCSPCPSIHPIMYGRALCFSGGRQICLPPRSACGCLHAAYRWDLSPRPFACERTTPPPSFRCGAGARFPAQLWCCPVERLRPTGLLAVGGARAFLLLLLAAAIRHAVGAVGKRTCMLHRRCGVCWS